MAMSPNDHDELREQAELYVLDALASSDRQTFEAHLASCAECRAQVTTLSPVTQALAYVVPQHDPPSDLRARVLTSITGTPGMAPASSTRPEGANVILPWLAAAASLVLAAGLGLYSASLRSRIGALEQRLQEATERASAGDRQIAELRHAAADAQQQLAVLAAPDLQRIDLAGQPRAPQASARAFWSRSRGLVFTASNLPTPPAGKTYQLWVLTKQPAPISAGVFKPDQRGRVAAVFETPLDLPQPVGMAVTVEPDGGVPSPTGDKYLVGL
jgi:anti-sigma-K factor RskA